MRARWEYQIQEGMRTMLRAVGFRVYWLSQYRRSNQEPGLPDLLVMHPVLNVEATIEVKAPNGRVSARQQEFRDLRIACGRVHLVGGLEVVQAWLLEVGLARRDPGGQLVLTPYRRVG